MAVNNRKLHSARAGKKDEFYTTYETVATELGQWRADTFRDKKIHLIADDPKSSQFWGYFVNNFDRLQLESLSATHLGCGNAHIYTGNKMETMPVVGGGNLADRRLSDWVHTVADIVVTNPPFSLARQFYRLYRDMGLLFVGPVNLATYRPVVADMVSGETFGGFSLKNGDGSQVWFDTPDGYDLSDATKTRVVGNRTQVCLTGIRWFTNLSPPPPPRPLPAYSVAPLESYDENPGIFECPSIINLPPASQAEGWFGVPITFFDYLPSSEWVLHGVVSPHVGGEPVFARYIVSPARLDLGAPEPFWGATLF